MQFSRRSLTLTRFVNLWLLILVEKSLIKLKQVLILSHEFFSFFPKNVCPWFLERIAGYIHSCLNSINSSKTNLIQLNHPFLPKRLPTKFSKHWTQILNFCNIKNNVVQYYHLHMFINWMVRELDRIGYVLLHFVIQEPSDLKIEFWIQSNQLRLYIQLWPVDFNWIGFI